MESLAYTPTALAAAMGVSRPTVYRWMRLPGFPVVRLGNCVRIPATTGSDALFHFATGAKSPVS